MLLLRDSRVASSASGIISSYIPTTYRSEDWQCSDNDANVGDEEEEVGGDHVDEEEIVDDEEEEEVDEKEEDYGDCL